MKRIRKKEEKPGSIWNPVNLQKEVHAFGYDFYWKSYLLSILGVMLLITVVGIFFKLKAGYVILVFLAALFALPLLIVNMYRRMYEQKRFADVTDYMEQVLYSFEKEHKILRALKECKDAIPDGRMKETISEAVDYIEAGSIKDQDKSIYEEAFSIIEDRYSCSRLHTVHELLISAEERGGNMEQSSELLIEDIEVWKRQVYGLQLNKKSCHVDTILSIVMAAAVCGIGMYIMDSVKNMTNAGKDVSIFALPAIQISSFAFILLCLYAFYKSSKKLASDWMVQDSFNRKTLQSAYEYVRDYDAENEKKKSIKYMVPFFLLSAVLFAAGHSMFAVLFLIIGVFLAVQHRVSYNMFRKEVEKALYEIFSEWMMDMSLLLQTNNVQVSIAKSIPRADDLLKEELELLSERIADEPYNVRSYTRFCEKFNIPEIGTCMKMLYSISEAGTGDAAMQIANLVSQVHKMQEKEAEIRNDDIGFKMRMICFYPVAGTSGKLLVDMLMGTLLIFQLFSTSV